MVVSRVQKPGLIERARLARQKISNLDRQPRREDPKKFFVHRVIISSPRDLELEGRLHTPVSGSAGCAKVPRKLVLFIKQIIDSQVEVAMRVEIIRDLQVCLY